METAILSNGRRALDPAYALVSERVETYLHTNVLIPFVVTAKAFVSDIKKILTPKTESEIWQESVATMEGLCRFSARLVDGVALAYKSATDNPKDMNTALDAAFDRLYSEFGIEDSHRDSYTELLLNITRKYQLQNYSNAAIFKTTLDLLATNPIAEGDSSIFSLESVASLVGAMNDLWHRLHTGLTPSLMVDTVLSLFGTDGVKAKAWDVNPNLKSSPTYATSTLANFANKLYTYLIASSGTPVSTPYYIAEKQIREMCGMPAVFKVADLFPGEPMISGESKKGKRDYMSTLQPMSFIHMLSDFRWRGGFSDKFLSFADLYFEGLKIKSGQYFKLENTIKLGGNVSRERNIVEVMQWMDSAYSCYTRLGLRVPSPVALADPDRNFESDIFQELYFYAITNRLLTQKESTTGAEFQNALSTLYPRKGEESIVSLFNQSFKILGTCYDAFVDVMVWIRSLMVDDRFSWGANSLERDFIKKLNDDFTKFAMEPDRSSTPRFLCSLTNVVNDRVVFEPVSPSYYISDREYDDIADMPRDKSRKVVWKTLRNVILNGDEFMAPVPQDRIDDFLVSTSKELTGKYIFQVSRPVSSSLSKEQCELLMLIHKDMAFKSGFKRLYHECSLEFSATDIESLSVRTGLPIDWLVAFGFDQEFIDNHFVYFLKWSVLDRHFVALDPHDLPIFEEVDHSMVMGLPTMFRSYWPYAVELTQPMDYTPTTYRPVDYTLQHSIFSPDAGVKEADTLSPGQEMKRPTVGDLAKDPVVPTAAVAHEATVDAPTESGNESQSTPENDDANTPK